VMCLYRNEQLIIPDEGERIEVGDEVMIITHRKNIDALHEQLGPVIDEEVDEPDMEGSGTRDGE
ncbi:MAG: hypothetical protein ACQER6_02485, partial [Pseudomonadota bacterium]